MKKWLLIACLATSLSACANHSTRPKEPRPMTQTIILPSAYTFEQTVQRLSQAFESKGMTVFATINHQAAAQKAGLSMQPATVIVFGTPKAGTPLMVKDPYFALQLPLRVLVTQVNGQVQVAFTDTHALIQGSQIQYSDVENTLANAEKLIATTIK